MGQLEKRKLTSEEFNSLLTQLVELNGLLDHALSPEKGSAALRGEACTDENPAASNEESEVAMLLKKSFW